MEMLFHVGHILKGVIFLNAPPLILVLEEMLEELFLQFSPICLLEGGKIVHVVGLEDMLKVLPPSGTLIVSGIL